MKILAFADSHLRSSCPISRIDQEFDETILDKIREIFEYAKKNADMIICLGDLFDSPNPSLQLLIKVIKLFNEYSDIPFYINVGNHDLYAHNMETLSRTAIGLLHQMSLIHIEDYVEINNIKIQFVQYYHGAEEDLKIKDKFPKCDVFLTHSMVTDHEFFGDYVLYNEVNQDYRVMLCSHYHPGFGYKKIGDKHIIACGSLTRTSLDQNNLTRQPSFVTIDIDEENVNCEIIPLKSAKPAEEVFLLQKALDPIDRDRREQLLVNINELNLESCDLPTIVEHYCNTNNIDEEIKREVLSRIGS